MIVVYYEETKREPKNTLYRSECGSSSRFNFFFPFHPMAMKKAKHICAVGLRQVVLCLFMVLKAAGHGNAGETGSGQRENASNDILSINIDRRGAEDSHSQPNTWRRVQGEK